ncbi:MAG: hypothetical protein ACXAC8_06675 [Candidatus Hodarchaeales archaeon]
MNEKNLDRNFTFKIIRSLFILGFIISSSNIASGILHQEIPIGEEYTSGTIMEPGPDFSYAWVNTNDTTFLSVIMFDEEYGAAPFYPFFGQSYSIENNSFFVGTVITGFELYQDSNNNGLLDLKEELKYYISLNASQEYVLPQIEKTTTETKRIYKWNVGYLEVDGFLSPFTGPNIRKTLIDSVNLTYTFEISSNYSVLKLAIEMGTWDAYEFTLDDNNVENRIQNIDLSSYSLSLLFGTTVSSESPFEIKLTNGANGLSDTIIEVNNVPIFQSLFHDTYDLGLNGSAFVSKAIPAQIETLYEEQLQEWGTPQSMYNWWGSFFSSMSNLTSVPSLGIEEVSFLYRICYSEWGGTPFKHDPRFLALFKGELISLPTDSSAPPTTPTTSTDQPTPFNLFPEILIILILIPLYRKKKN